MSHKKHRVSGRQVFLFKVGVIGLLTGGIGNFIDRIGQGFVRDFIDLSPVITFYNWPIFNIADVLIFIGVFSILVYEWRKGG